MININQFISQYVTRRNESMFLEDIDSNKEHLYNEIRGKNICVIGGAGTIGSSFIKSILHFNPAGLTVIDVNENGLVELIRDLRSTFGTNVPDEFKTYPISYSDQIFKKIFLKKRGFDIVANFSAHKHVRSEKDQFSIEALLENNVLAARGLLDLLAEFPPKHFFCVSTDKAVNPVNIMGASKKLMESMIMAYSDKFKVSTARFANVAFSNGSLLAGCISRIMNSQPLVAPNDIRRYFVSPKESGQICMLACILGYNREIFFPKLNEDSMLTFSSICDDFLHSMDYEIKYCSSVDEAKLFASQMRENNRVYPVFYSNSDTTGEKEYEKFYENAEELDLTRFKSLGIITNYKERTISEIDSLFTRLNTVFMKPDLTKDEIVDILRDFLPNFNHDEKGKNLDQKM